MAPIRTIEIIASLGPIATAIAAIVALSIGVITIRQRAWADRRDHWWKRAKWALELSMGGDPIAQQIGLNALEYLGKSELTKYDEAMMLSATALAMAETNNLEAGDKNEFDN